MSSLKSTLLLIGSALLSGCLLKNNAMAVNSLLPASALIGKLFLNALMMSVFPLILSSVILGMSKVGRDQYGRKLAFKVGTTFFCNSLLAVAIGWLVFRLFYPFLPVQSSVTIMPVSNEMSLFTNILLKLFPRNIFEALAQGDMISSIVFCMLFGFCLGSIEHSLASTMNNVLQAIFDTTLSITRLVMHALPLGIFALVFDASMKINLAIFHSLALFFVMILFGLFLYMFLCLCILRLTANVDPIKFLSVMQTSLLRAFSTSSSAVTLPAALDCLEQQCGLDPRLTRFMIPLGISINMSGTGLFTCASALYLSFSYGYPMNFMTQLTIVFLAWITSFGIAGIPSGCLVALMVVLNALGVPNEAIGLIIGFDRILDMFRTVCNIFANASCALFVAHADGQKITL